MCFDPETPHSEEDEGIEDDEVIQVAPPEVIPVAPPAAEKRPEEIKLVSPPSIRMAPCKVSPTSDVASIGIATSLPAPIQVSPPASVQIAPPAVEVASSTEHRNKMKVDLTRLNTDRNGSAAGRTPLGINVMKVKPVTLEVLSPTGENDQKLQNWRESSKTNVPESSKTNVRESLKTNVRESPKTNVRESPKTNVRESSKTNVRESLKTNVRESSMTNVRESPKTNVRESLKTNVRESSKTNVQESSKTNVRESLKTNIRESSKTNVRESLKTNVREPPKTNVQESLKTDVRESSKTNVQESLKTNVQESLKTNVRESSKTNVQESLKTDVRESKTNVRESLNLQESLKTNVREPSQANVRESLKTNVRESSKTNESTAIMETAERNKTKENGSFVSQVTMSVNSDVKPKLPSAFELVPSNSVNKELGATLTGTKVTPSQKSDSLVYQMTLSLNDPKMAPGGAGAKVQTAPPWRASSVRTGVTSVKESPFKQSEAAGKPVTSYMKDQKSNASRQKSGSPAVASYLKSKPANQVATPTLKSNSVSVVPDKSRAQTSSKVTSTTAVSLQKPRRSSLTNKEVASKASVEQEAPTARKVNSKFAQMQQKFSGSSASSSPKDKGFGTVYSKTKTQLKSDVSVSNTNEKRPLSKLNTEISSKTTRVLQINGSKDDAVTAVPSSTKSSLIVQVTNTAVKGKVHQKGQPVSLIIDNDHRKDPVSTLPLARTANPEEVSISVNKSPSPCVISDAPLSLKTNGGIAETNNNTYVQSQTLSMKSSSLKPSDPPQFVRRLEDQMVMDGDRVELVVKITGMLRVQMLFICCCLKFILVLLQGHKRIQLIPVITNYSILNVERVDFFNGRNIEVLFGSETYRERKLFGYFFVSNATFWLVREVVDIWKSTEGKWNIFNNSHHRITPIHGY